MPAETHQFIEDLDVDRVLELLVILVGVDAGQPTIPAGSTGAARARRRRRRPPPLGRGWPRSTVRRSVGESGIWTTSHRPPRRAG